MQDLKNRGGEFESQQDLFSFYLFFHVKRLFALKTHLKCENVLFRAYLHAVTQQLLVKRECRSVNLYEGLDPRQNKS